MKIQSDESMTGTHAPGVPPPVGADDSALVNSKRRFLSKRVLVERVFKNAAELARVTGCTRGAVSRWAMDEPIPELYELRLRYVVMPQYDWAALEGA